MPVGNRVDQTARADDPSQDISVVSNESDPGHGLIHSVDLFRRRHRRANSRSVPPIRFQRGPNDLNGGTPYPRRPSGARKGQ